jgi:DNA repair photolyase
MLISASRRTDIPAFYSRWLMNRLEAGFADVVNPFNPPQVRRVDLRPESVDAIIFWTRNPRPLIKILEEIDSRGFKYYFLYTITGYPRVLEENLPSLETSIETFQRLSDRIGPEYVIWRYDPIVLTSFTNADFHRRNFERICGQLSGYTRIVIVSFVDLYKKVRPRLAPLLLDNITDDDLLLLARDLAGIAGSYGLKIRSCAEEIDLASAGVKPGKCIDDGLASRLKRHPITYEKDPNQRRCCRCTRSVDIGAYQTCGYRCLYCYANSSFEVSAQNMKHVTEDSLCLAPTKTYHIIPSERERYARL